MMNQLIAKIKNKKRSGFDGFKKIISDIECYNTPTNFESLNYDPNTLLDIGQWYYIDHFSMKTFCIDIIKEDFCSVDIDSLDKDDFQKIDYLLSCQDDIYYFQKVRPAQLVKKKRLWSLGESYMFDANNISIVINTFPDAFYKKQDDILYFQKLETISSIFKGIEVLYREATNEEVESFLNSDFIKVNESINKAEIGKLSRKRIAMAITTLNSFNDEQKQAVIQYTKENSGLMFENNKFVLTNEEDIKKLAWGISERYYETPVSRQKRVANSVINLQTGETQSEI